MDSTARTRQAAEPSLVYSMLVDPAELRHWLGSRDWVVTLMEADVRVDGVLRFSMRNLEGGEYARPSRNTATAGAMRAKTDRADAECEADDLEWIGDAERVDVRLRDVAAELACRDPPASAMRWRIGRNGHTVVNGRQRTRLDARVNGGLVSTLR